METRYFHHKIRYCKALVKVVLHQIFGMLLGHQRYFMYSSK